MSEPHSFLMNNLFLGGFGAGGWEMLGLFGHGGFDLLLLSFLGGMERSFIGIYFSVL